MREISCFVDESGSDNLRDRYSLIALVLHEQSEPLTQEIGSYEQSLGDKELPDIPLHAGPLMTGYEDCAGMSIASRKRLLSSFRVFLRNLPIRYTCISLRLSEFEDKAEVEVAMRRAIANFLFGHLAYFQGFDDIKIYYDDGQDTVSHAMHGAMDLRSPVMPLSTKQQHLRTIVSRKLPIISSPWSLPRSATRIRVRPPRTRSSLEVGGSLNEVF